MEYGKLIDGVLHYAPKDLILGDGRVIVDYNKDQNRLIADGYKVVVNTVPKHNPDIEYISLIGYSSTEDSIFILYTVKTIDTRSDKEKQADLLLSLLAQPLTDEQALLVPLVYLEYKYNHHYKVNEKFRYEGVLYKVLVEHDTHIESCPLTDTSVYTRLSL